MLVRFRLQGNSGFFGLALSAFLLVSSAHCQSASQPIVGGTGGLTVSDGYGRFSFVTPQRHKSPTGQPCVTVHGLSKPQIVTPTIYDHILIIQNVCSAPIKLRLCYFQSSQCINTVSSGYSRRQQLLGLGPNAKDFRYAYTEEF
jgi:hypothetical protein